MRECDGGDEQGWEIGCVPQNAVTTKNEAYGESDPPSHKGAHSIQTITRGTNVKRETRLDILH